MKWTTALFLIVLWMIFSITIVISLIFTENMSSLAYYIIPAFVTIICFASDLNE